MSLHNDIATWAGRARARGQDRIELDIETAMLVAEIVRLAPAECELEARRSVSPTYSAENGCDHPSGEFAPLADPVIQAEFWQRVDVRGPAECWHWSGFVHASGYGRFSIDGRQHLAHRIALFLEKGESPEDAGSALHSCDNPRCVNPSHLRWGTHLDNVADALERGRFRRSSGSRAGSRNPKAKLTQEKVEEIRAKYAPFKYTNRMLAEEYGVSETTIYYIVSRRTWS